ncbi:hypothetical protein EJ05DRAFT_255032 [Pseudovirgaria hyperparasitica]|uniref:Cyclin-like protein n=1 Tax=Pseudovirgaria hyperparasitica TaxID=470096 RepID=A0A6A6WEC2_9PEZI|nr:uncharacterized protein EJ05DRAFT_255032 [Pseudovirgaria hyperparasitica]KAF2761172.1 hypothetical protein EJ05DRAFT_255032 [Pseudovirgaria hyperparasitica]
MPAYYPRHMPRHMPLTPPEFVPGYNNSCARQYPQLTHGAPSLMRQHDDGGFGYSERYDQPHLPSVQSALMYGQQQHHGGYANNAVASYYEPVVAPILPPMRGTDQRTMADADMLRAQRNTDARATQQKEEKPTGGVSANLDYELDVMTDFVSDMAQGIISPNRPQPPSFRKWVGGVLTATRLPSATILLGLHYLSLRMTQLSQEGPQMNPETNLHRFLTLGLLLGSKFLDDNTFINRSWADVSGIVVADLNVLESQWLKAFDFRLHRNPEEAQGFTTWLKHWKEFEANAVARANRQTKLAPIDTSLHQYSGMKSFSTNPYTAGFKQLPTPDYSLKHTPSQYSAPAYSQYDPWSARSTHDHSPASTAPLSGPTTPEYYGNATTWAPPPPPEGYSRRTMFGFPPASQPMAALQQHLPSYGSSCFGAASQQYNLYNGHPPHCSCFHCCARHPPYMMTSGFATQPVAG